MSAVILRVANCLFTGRFTICVPMPVRYCTLTPLRLAPYTVTHQQIPCTLTVKQNRRSHRFSVQDGVPRLHISLSMYASIADTANSRPPEQIADGGDLPTGLLTVAAKRLKEQITQTVEKCRSLQFDVFNAIGMLQKYENAHFEQFKDSLIERLEVSIDVTFGAVR